MLVIVGSHLQEIAMRIELICHSVSFRCVFDCVQLMAKAVYVSELFLFHYMGIAGDFLMENPI